MDQHKKRKLNSTANRIAFIKKKKSYYCIDIRYSFSLSLKFDGFFNIFIEFGSDFQNIEPAILGFLYVLTSLGLL